MARPLVTTPLRSMLFTPGSNEKMVAKAPASGADGALFDLEDSVAPAQKEKARELVGQAIPGLKTMPGAPLTTLVRVNAVETGLLEKDLEAVAVAGLDAIFLPKPESAADARTADAILTRLEKDRSLEALCVGADRLSVFAWAFRYPGDPEEPTRAEVEGALNLSREVFEAMLSRLPAELRP